MCSGPDTQNPPQQGHRALLCSGPNGLSLTNMPLLSALDSTLCWTSVHMTLKTREIKSNVFEASVVCVFAGSTAVDLQNNEWSLWAPLIFPFKSNNKLSAVKYTLKSK